MHSCTFLSRGLSTQRLSRVWFSRVRHLLELLRWGVGGL